jgi:2-dehydropantoate 2-reductase
MARLKIGIVGTGAMGSVYAAFFASAGHEVWAIDRWREHVDAMNARGLRLEGASGDRTVKLHATTDADTVGPCDLVVLATKAMHVTEGAQAAMALLGPDTPVISMQNGLGGPDAAAAILTHERVIVGVVGGFGASMKGPGHAHHNGMELVRLGELRGAVSPRLREAGRVWESAGFTVKLFDDIDQLVWEKLLCNCAYSGPCGISGWTVGEVMKDPDMSRVSSDAAAEAFEVARACGVKLGFDDPVKYIREFGAKIPGARPSILLDLLAKRRTEVDVINGAIPRVATTVGMDAPVNDMITALVHVRERQLGCN